jgi:hypothetical protein
VTIHGDENAAGSEQRVEKILTLFRNVGRLEAQLDFEHSFKAVRRHLFDNRFLLGVERPALMSDRDERIISVCQAVGMPQNLLASFTQSLADANHVYFGAEKGDSQLLFKVYLEFRDKAEREIAASRRSGVTFPLFVGFKWDAFGSARQAVTKYAWHPSLPFPEILSHLRTTIEPDRHTTLWGLVRGIVEQAAARMSHHDIQYLEVTEDGNPRRSFDINLYKSGLRLEELHSYLLDAVTNYDIPPARFESLYRRISKERFGHLAGGVDRENNDFITIYFGAKRMHSEQFRSARLGASDRTDRDD